MQTTDAKTLNSDRHAGIDDTANGLLEAILNATGASGAPEEPVAARAVTLLAVGLHALVDIADAQQRMAALAERDIAGEIDAIVNERLADKIRIHETESKTRSFIGKKPKDA